MGKTKSKLIRNLKQGDEFQLTDATVYPNRIIHARASRDAYEVEWGFMTRRRRWRVPFDTVSTSDNKRNYTWHAIVAYSDERIDLL